MSSATKAPGAEGPGDWVLVPRDPLPEMLGAFWRTKNTGTTEIGGKYQDSSDVAAYRAMIAAAPFSTTAPTPTDRVGEDVGRLERVRHLKRGTEYEVLGEAEAQVATGTVRTTMLGKPLGNIYRRIADGSSLTVYRDPTTGKLWCRPTDEFRDGRFETIASAPAPSDPAGAGGDLDWLLRQVIELCEDTETKTDEALSKGPTNEQEIGFYRGRAYEAKGVRRAITEVARLREEDRSGQIIASTPEQKGAGEEKTGACLTAPGSREPGPSVPASGFDPSRKAVEMMAEHLHEEADYDRQWRWPEHADDDGYRGNGGYVTITPTDVQCRLREQARRVLIRADQIRARGALAGEARSAETQSGSVEDEHAAPQGATPAQTPPSPPPATPEGDPPMTVEEARAFLDGLSSSYMASEHYARWLRLRADDVPFPTKERDVDRQLANDIELALRTLHAAGEVRHG